MMRHTAIALLTIALVLVNPASAEESDIDTIDGAFLGKWKYQEIQESDALLQLNHAGRALLSVNAGYIGNNLYRENWRFRDGHIIYDKLPSFTYYQISSTPEEDAQTQLCGSPIEGKCEILTSRKLSKNTVMFAARSQRNNNVCGITRFIEEEIPGQDNTLFGDYSVLSTYCLPPGSDPEKAISASAYFASSIRKGGKRIANLDRYDLPPQSFSFRSTDDGSQTAVASAANSVFQIFYEWEGVTDSGSGTLATRFRGNAGTLSADIGLAAGSCSGKWERKDFKNRQAGELYGIWHMTCGTNISLSGTFELTGPRKGVGEGLDSNGRKIEFRFYN